MGNDIFKKIRKLRVKLEEAITKKGLNSPEVREISNKMDELLNDYEKNTKIVEFPKYSMMPEWYKKSYRDLKKITEDFKKFPSVEEWNMYAKTNNLLCNVSLEYITQLNWNYLKIKSERELNFKVIKSPEKK